MTDNKIIKTATSIVNSPKTPEEYCKAANIDLMEIYSNLNRIATKAVLVAKGQDGDPVKLGPDNRNQLAATLVILELVKHIKDKSIATQIAIINDSDTMVRASELRRAKERLSAIE